VTGRSMRVYVMGGSYKKSCSNLLFLITNSIAKKGERDRVLISLPQNTILLNIFLDLKFERELFLIKSKFYK